MTITMCSRIFGNSDHNLSLFLDSFIEFTHYPDRVEILIKVDDDDDLPFFYDIKRRYSARVNLRIFPGARGIGYAGMHLWHHNLIKNRNPNAKLDFILTDDAAFEFKHWDDQLVSLLERREDTYFIGTACSLDEAITFVGPNPVTPVPVYWIHGDDYPIFGFDLLVFLPTPYVQGGAGFLISSPNFHVVQNLLHYFLPPHFVLMAKILGQGACA